MYPCLTRVRQGYVSLSYSVRQGYVSLSYSVRQGYVSLSYSKLIVRSPVAPVGQDWLGLYDRIFKYGRFFNRKFTHLLFCHSPKIPNNVHTSNK